MASSTFAAGTGGAGEQPESTGKDGRKSKGGNQNKGKLVLAGGAVLYRPGPEGEEIAVVHRKRYDDWSLPKGKVDPGEALPVTAVREIAEETGSRCVLGRRLGTTGYPLKAGARKEVTYWAARAIGGGFEPNDEVDELRWLPLERAAELVSYSLDRKVLKAYSAGREATGTVVLIRHARAGSRSQWSGEDALRPLDKQGRAQAELLAPLALAFGVRSVHSAPLVRCEQTVAPLAAALGATITPEEGLSDDGVQAHPRRGLRRLIEIGGAAEAVAVCSQGGAIPELVRRWASAAESGDGTGRGKGGGPRIDVGDASTRKGGCWVLRGSGPALLSADYYPSPLPVR